jgi:hypothetical protein
MHTLQNKKNKDQFNNRERNEKRREKRVLVETLKAPWPEGLTGPPANAVTPRQTTKIKTKYDRKEQHNTRTSQQKEHQGIKIQVLL